jgi:hypothetical protein
VSLGAPLLARPQHTAACVSLLQNHNVKERHSAKKPDFGGHFPEPAHAMPKPGACGPRRLGPGGRRGFYARPLVMSTTFSRKKRNSQHFEKSQENQRDFCAPERMRCLRKTFGSRNDFNLPIRLTGFKPNAKRRRLL